MSDDARNQDSNRHRLAIIGGGSSGLISLKMALDFLPDWEITCFEKSDSIQGCWGNPYPGFVSTSTKYTTQFSCYPVVDASISPDGGDSRDEFFREGEYGQYLEEFANQFELRQHIQLNTLVEKVQQNPDGTWNLAIAHATDQTFQEQFEKVIICTGLAAKPKPIPCDVPQLAATDLNQPGNLEKITHKKIVVIGGGESAVDYANRLANPKLENDIYLSLHSGVRVSPQYHPVRGVPSDFLRNRFMLSVHPDIRNWLGQIFVELRIKYQPQFQKLFPPKSTTANSKAGENRKAARIRKHWTFELTKAAKDDLFNMFHNKSDDFLQAVGEERIKIVGKPVDKSHSVFHPFNSNDGSGSSQETSVHPDLLVPAIGYASNLKQLTDSQHVLSDFFLGCCHIEQNGLFLVGFARPIIGNIPSISEMQARYVCGVIAGKFQLPDDTYQLHKADREFRRKRYNKLNLEAVYPVEMFPYCDRLASLMKLPIGKGIPLGINWWKTRLAPATTLHYFQKEKPAKQASESAPVYMPTLLILFILLMKPIDWIYKLFK